MAKKLKLLWLTDPWETLDYTNDTTLRLVEEAQLRGHTNYWSESRSVFIKDRLTHAHAKKVTKITSPRAAKNIQMAKVEELNLTQVDFVLYRTDPPLGLSYWLPLQLLYLGSQTQKKFPKIINPLALLFFQNEKTMPLFLENLYAKTFVSSDHAKLLDFIRRQGRAIVKPLYSAQSKGVTAFNITDNDDKIIKAIQSLTQNQTIPICAQEFLPGALQGEIRLWFVKGQLIANVLKKPKAGESIINMDQGGTLATIKLNSVQKSIAGKIGTLLKKQGILWAAVDMIDDKITDLNFTSPGLVVAMETLLKENLASKIVASLE